MTDESQLQLAKDGDSSPSLSKARSGLIARGRRDATALILPAQVDPLSEVRRLAEEGDMDAQFELGEAFYNGYVSGSRDETKTGGHVQIRVPQDYAEALNWYRKAADQSQLYAISNLGDMYASGEGVPADSAEARRWYLRAADIALSDGGEQWDQWDPDWLRWAILQGGEHGHAKAQPVAVYLYRDSAEKGEAYGQFGLGSLYFRGQGVPQDYVQAHLWTNLAASAATGTVQTKYSSARDAIAAKMTPNQIADAQALAREWKPKSPK